MLSVRIYNVNSHENEEKKLNEKVCPNFWLVVYVKYGKALWFGDNRYNRHLQLAKMNSSIQQRGKTINYNTWSYHSILYYYLADEVVVGKW